MHKAFQWMLLRNLEKTGFFSPGSTTLTKYETSKSYFSLNLFPILKKGHAFSLLPNLQGCNKGKGDIIYEMRILHIL